MSTKSEATEPPWRAGLRAALATAVPGLVLQVAALSLVIAYYHHASVHQAVGRLADLHERTGILFGVISAGLFAGFIPFIYLRCRSATRNRFTWVGGAALTIFWAYKGMEVDLWYRLMAHTVGASNAPATIAVKTFLDQFVYCPLFAVPVTVLFYQWIEAHFDASAVRRDLRTGRWYRRRVLPVLISNMGVWIPAVCIIYSLPTPLQLPLQNLVLCFFTLLLAHVMPGKGGRDPR